MNLEFLLNLHEFVHFDTSFHKALPTPGMGRVTSRDGPAARSFSSSQLLSESSRTLSPRPLGPCGHGAMCKIEHGNTWELVKVLDPS